MDGSIVAYDPFAPLGAWQKGGIEHRRVNELRELLWRGTRENAISLKCALGGIADQAALLRALQETKIYGAALHAVDFELPTLQL